MYKQEKSFDVPSVVDSSKMPIVMKTCSTHQCSAELLIWLTSVSKLFSFVGVHTFFLMLKLVSLTALYHPRCRQKEKLGVVVYSCSPYSSKNLS